MDSTPYQKREIDEKLDNLKGSMTEGFEDVHKKIDDVTDYQNQKLESIERIGTATDLKVGIQNGRVGKLENRAAWITGVGATAIFLFGFILTLIVYSFQLSQENLKQAILLQVHAENSPKTPEDIAKKIEELQAETKLLQTQIQKTQ